VVEFLEGDPDRPLIVGAVYNPREMPPYTLPAGANTMGFKSNTTKGGGGYNEMVAIDAKGNELVRIHAQKDMDTTVLNDDRQTVLNDRTIRVDGKHTEAIKEDMSVTVIEGNQTNTVSAGSQKNLVHTTIDVESETDAITIKSPTKITLQVGESSWIEITPGKITINSPQIESSAKGQNLITGVNVDINP
jgi:type VI secretion system secreted protein VgrG